MLGVRRWRQLVADRKKLGIVRQAKTHSELYCQWKKKKKKKLGMGGAVPLLNL